MNRIPSPSLGGKPTLRQLFATPAVAWTIAASILVTCMGVGLAPRLLEVAAQEDLLATVSKPDPAQRNFTVQRFGRFGAAASGDPFAAVARYGDSFTDGQIPESVTSIISSHSYVVDSPEFSVSPMPGEDPPHPFPMFLRFRYMEGIESRTTVVEGELPSPQPALPALIGTECPVDPDERADLLDRISASGPIDGMDCEVGEIPHFQVAVSAQTAEALGIELGQLMRLRPDPTDRLFFGLAGEALSYELGVSISGIIELTDPGEEFWFGDESLHRPTIQENADLRIISATGLMAPESYGPMLTATGEAQRRYTWRYFVDPEAVTGSDIEGLISDLHAFELHFSSVAARPTDPSVTTMLSDLLAAHLAQRKETVSMLSIAVAGAATSALVVVLLAALLLTFRQRHDLAVARARGAGLGQVTLTRAYQGLLVTVPPALAGYLIGETLLPETDSEIAYKAAVAVTAVSISLICAALAPAVLVPLRDLLGRRQRLPRTHPRWLVFEAFVVVVAIGATLTVRRRGLSDAANATDLDLLLAATPSILALAGGLVAVRLYRPLVRLMSVPLAWLRGVVGLLGVRRLSQLPLQAILPLLGIVVCVALAGFATVMRTTIASGQQATSWNALASDFAVLGSTADVNIPVSVDLEELSARYDTAYGKTFLEARAVTSSGRLAAHVLAVDTVAHQELLNGTPADPGYPAEMLERSNAEIGTEDDPIPVIVSDGWPSTVDLEVGDRLRLSLGGLQPEAMVVEVRENHPGIAPQFPFVVLDLAQLASTTDIELQPTVVYLGASEAATDEIEQLVFENTTSARVVSRYTFLADIAEDPLIEWSGRILAFAFALSAVFAVMAVVISHAMGAETRERDSAHLSTLGMDARSITAMAFVEQLPPTLTGTAIGMATAVLATVALRPAVRLGGFAGTDDQLTLDVDWAGIGLVSFLLFGTMVAATSIFLAVRRRRGLGATLRLGEP